MQQMPAMVITSPDRVGSLPLVPLQGRRPRVSADKLFQTITHLTVRESLLIAPLL